VWLKEPRGPYTRSLFEYLGKHCRTTIGDGRAIGNAVARWVRSLPVHACEGVLAQRWFRLYVKPTERKPAPVHRVVEDLTSDDGQAPRVASPPPARAPAMVDIDMRNAMKAHSVALTAPVVRAPQSDAAMEDDDRIDFSRVHAAPAAATAPAVDDDDMGVTGMDVNGVFGDAPASPAATTTPVSKPVAAPLDPTSPSVVLPYSPVAQIEQESKVVEHAMTPLALELPAQMPATNPSPSRSLLDEQEAPAPMADRDVEVKPPMNFSVLASIPTVARPTKGSKFGPSPKVQAFYESAPLEEEEEPTVYMPPRELKELMKHATKADLLAVKRIINPPVEKRRTTRTAGRKANEALHAPVSPPPEHVAPTPRRAAAAKANAKIAGKGSTAPVASAPKITSHKPFKPSRSSGSSLM